MYYTVTFREYEIGQEEIEFDINFIACDNKQLMELIKRFIKHYCEHYYDEHKDILLISPDGMKATLNYKSIYAYYVQPFSPYAKFIDADDEQVFHEITVGEQIPPVDTMADVDFFCKE